MRITIDTKTDSRDEIRKAIRLLMGLVGGQDVYTNDTPAEKPPAQPNIFDSPSPAVGNLMSIFDSADTPQKTEEKPKEDSPKIELY